MSQEYAEAVHRVAGRIPAGSVLTYGDIAELLGSGGPRQVGAAMSRSAAALPWWRVVRANGTLPADLQERALPQWEQEDIPVLRGRVRVTRARWQPEEGDFDFLDTVAATLAGVNAPETASNRRGQVL